jgi:hypothetical protein
MLGTRRKPSGPDRCAIDALLKQQDSEGHAHARAGEERSLMTVSADSTVVCVEHRFDASAEQVYDAFLDPERAGKFMFATPTGQVVRCDIDARVGGTFTIVDRRGGEDVVHTGTYVALQRPRLIVCTLVVEKYSSQRRRLRG